MKENNELERADLVIDRDMEADCDIGQEITVYIEAWFDADKKFGLNIADEDGTWLNLYGKYNPFEDTLRIECEISREDGSEYFDYTPTEAESKLIKDMIAEKIWGQWHQTPQEFCGDIQNEMTMGGLTFLYTRHCRAAVYCGAGAASDRAPCRRHTLLWLSDHPSGRYDHTGFYEIRRAVLYIYPTILRMEVSGR